MHVALVILRADASLGGAEGYTVGLASSLLAAGHAVTFVAQSFADALPPGAAKVAIPASALTRAGRYDAFLDGVEAHLASARYDVVHAMLPVRSADVYHPHAGLAIDGVEAGHLRHNDPLRRALSRLGNRFNRKRQRFAAAERALLEGPRPPRVACLSQAMRASTLRHYRIDGALVRTVYYGIDLDRFDEAARAAERPALRARLGLRDDQVAALFVGQDFQRKGLAEAIAAIAAAADGPADGPADDRLALVVVGKDDPAPYRALAARLGVAPRVHFAGPTADVPAFIAASDLLLFPSRVEPCGLVVFESLAMGRPVVTTRQAGASELVEEAVTGFVADDPRDVEALAAACRQLLDPALRQRMRAAALALRPRLSQHRHLAELFALYAQGSSA